MICVVTDRRLVPGDLAAHVDAALAAVPAGVMVQLREKDLDGRALLALARSLREVTRARGAIFLVNDRLDVALAAGADGVQLPENGFPVARARALLPAGALVGVSIHDPADPRRAEADLALLSPIFASPGKGAPIGLDGVRGAIALGGIDATNAAAAMRAGARGVAVIRAIMAASDPGAAMRALWSAVHA